MSSTEEGLTKAAGAASQIRAVDDLYGPAGRLEALLNSGRDDAAYSVLICHPHPAGGGNMHNKVVYNAMKVFSSLGLPVLRFNFRGTGLSEGVHDDGHGEQEDVRAALSWLEDGFAGRPILFAGFSFGASVGMRACCGDVRVKGMIGLGVPVHAEGRDYTYGFLQECVAPKLFITGAEDPYAPRDQMKAIFEQAAEPKEMVWIPEANHFFQGTAESPGAKLAQMQSELRMWLEEMFELV